jgi:hypothetical protein
MKTFGILIPLFLATLIITFNTYKGATIEEMLKMIIATQLAYIIYRLIKDEDKN